ncbi:ROK family transcriptional regulator [Klugiella xanthotipulae]|uniref:Putative NBD/HSP70 family sugar kinase n=1 Tax=Klugiella xanthotipulae TaxID=244735 RepID=A0A543I513_9MICO|nr:ROK family transcriptional regulator [Klugiella xanthotipulae]TQM65692.1 putative NBD/HSP70 family sugar kinase [Klugiella xanthotipulae]
MPQGNEQGRSHTNATAVAPRRAGRVLRPSVKVLPEHARRHNRSLVLQQVYRTSGLSRADIARQTGLTRVTVSDLVSELVAEGLVTELGQREDARPGKPATLLEMNLDAFHLIGLDLSDKSVFRAAILDLSGRVRERAEAQLDGATGELAIGRLMDLVAELVGRASRPLLGIGVGSPGIVDRGGVVRSAPNLRWAEVPLQSILAERFRLPVTVSNDANAAVLAEHSFGQSADDIILVQIGAGVGAGLIIDGSPVLGSHSAAGEIGHVVVGTDGGPLCACGKEGCLEVWVSVPHLTAQLLDAPTEAARTEVLTQAGQRLGIALAPVVGVLNLTEIVLSGPTELVAGTFAEATLNTIRQRTIAGIHGDLALRMTALSRDIVLRGAAVLVLSGQLGVS